MSFFRALLGRCDTEPLSPDLWGVEGDKVRVKLSQMPQPLPRGGGVYLKEQGLRRPVLVVRTDDDQYLAFENRCTHAGRKVDPVAGEARLRCCSLSHSVFDLDGNVVKGPAKNPLKKYAVEQTEGDLVISL